MAATEVQQPLDREAFLKMAKYPLIKSSDMMEEMRNEAVEMVITAVEKYSNNYELAARLVKESMDKKFGGPWHCIVGEYYGFEVTHEVKNLLYVFAAGYLAIILWKG
ncbi:Dynein light chain type 1 family protein [Klebsormidium nitens]|uniref:Dynein light chain n=1 Tax=Klebsormidium nitens TaxID=105231 RepID=A0A1Y1HN48_KLENI|nr:Dynein light chain type 1 family protein [Klebsormidium nitens]|eukprot:GAQ80054.1 Dynein light chain type 1 family protein [Klebsormidium nitens]